MPFSYKPLWRILLENELSKTEFRLLFGFSTATLAKLGKNEYVAMDVIDKICTYFEIQPNDIMVHISE